MIVPAGHKVALCDLEANQSVYKYGYPIGQTTQPIEAGEHVHSHNLRTGLSGAEAYTYSPVLTRPIKAIDYRPIRF